MYRDGSITDYVGDAAAKKPAPGGGSVSALVGALAAAMSEMSANFTTGKKKFADVQEEVRKALDTLEACRTTLLELLDRDVEAYSAVSRAYALPGDSEEEQEARRKAIDSALRGAMQAPLEVMRQCAAVAEVADVLVEIGNRNLITDVGVSALLAEAACAAARMNVEINLKFLKEAELAERTRSEVDGLTRQTRSARERVSRQVGRYLAS
ncbi:MAG: cyclodeaminase/cyclohydrolase family protein [Candidatus Brocadiaceae bacterium]